MRLRLRIATALALLLALLAVPSVASASPSQIYKDCADGAIDHNYSQKDYADALAHMPADIDEYTDCRSQIQRKQLGGGGGGSNGSGGGTAGGGGTTGGTGGGTGAAGSGDTGTGGGAPDPLATATPAEKAAFNKAVAAGDQPIKLDGRPIYPGELGGAKTTGLSNLPTPMLAVLALLILAGIGAAGLGTRRLVLGRRTA
jgi:hypothetical protein